MPWSTPFDEPIALLAGRNIVTLRQVADDIRKLPDEVQHQSSWRIAVEKLIDAAETCGGCLTFAHIAVSRALNSAASGLRLFQRAVDRREFAAELRPDALHSDDDRHGDTACDQAVLDRGGTGLIIQKL